MAGTIKARSHVVLERNRFGQFISEVEAAAHRTVDKTVEQGARTSRALAPAGQNRGSYAKRPGYVPLKRSIRTHVAGTRGYWYSIAPHAMHVEFGTGPHPITGFLRFGWRGGMFHWEDPRYGPYGTGKPYENWDYTEGATVNHPGTPEQSFLREAYRRVVKRQMMEIAKREFPG